MGSSRSVRVWPLVIAGSVILFAGWVAASVFNEAQRAAKTSAQLALFEEAKHLLEEYRAEHAEYPKSLDSLEFTFPDGGDQSMLALMKYESNGKTYSLVTKSVFSGEEHRVSR